MRPSTGPAGPVRYRFTDPLPGGTIGRVDQGVDISAAPGSPILAIADSRVVGVIPNWFKGQSYVWFVITSGPAKGKFWYAAEQIDFSSKAKTPGQSFKQGERIGTYAASGTGTEFGFAAASGKTLARATTGYKEGQVTPAGTAFDTQVLKNAGGIVRPGGNPSSSSSSSSAGGSGDGGASATDLFGSYATESGVQRTAPPGFVATRTSGGGQFVDLGSVLASPFTYWWGQFSSSWENVFKDFTGIFGTVGDAIKGPVDFLKFIAWLFHPRNILRAVEFLTGIALLALGLHSSVQAYGEARGQTRGPGGAVRRSGLGRLIEAGVEGTAAGRAARVARGKRAGRHQARREERGRQHQEAFKAGKRAQVKRQSSKRLRRESRKVKPSDIPF